MSNQTISPFDTRDNYTKIHNYVLDVIMPELPPNAWKILCFILRKTKGWGKDTEQLSYSTIREGTGIKSDTTLRTALQELTTRDYILVRMSGNKWDANHYALNTTLKIEAAPTPIFGVESTPKIEAAPTPKIGENKRKERKKERKENKELPATQGEASPAPTDDTWWANVEALCWVCHGHTDVHALTEKDRAILLHEAKVIFTTHNYTKDDLRSWFKEHWCTKSNWKWRENKERPRPSDVRAGIPVVRAAKQEEAQREEVYQSQVVEQQQASAEQKMWAEIASSLQPGIRTELITYDGDTWVVKAGRNAEWLARSTPKIQRQLKSAGYVVQVRFEN